MATVKQTHFYDEQIRRYILQFIRIFSGFTVKTGKKMNDGVTDYYIRTPARYGDVYRMAATIMKGNSENIINSAPFISCWIQSLQPDRSRVQEPFFNDAVAVTERKFDENTQKYTNAEGNRYNVKRLMPVTYLLNMQVDVWTSNTDQKLQLMEQILVLFNPALEIQHNDNPVDWTTITTVELTDIQWSSRGIPAGIEDQIDIATMFFQIPIWINPPAQVTRQNVIRNIIHNLYTYSDLDTLDYDPDAFEFFRDLQKEASVVVTPENYALQITENNGQYVAQPLANGNYADGIKWEDVFKNYGNLDDGISRLRLKFHGNLEDDGSDIIGTISSTPNPEIIEFAVDTATLPTNTIGAVDRVIDAGNVKPGFNNFPNPALGQRYLSLTDANSQSIWGIDINENDIIEYNGSGWIKSFDSKTYTLRAYVTNAKTGQQFKFEDGTWNDTFQGIYDGGYWRLELLQ